MKMDRWHILSWALGLGIGMIFFMFMGLWLNIEYDSQPRYIIDIGLYGIMIIISIISCLMLFQINELKKLDQKISPK